MPIDLGMPTLIEMPDIDETIELCKQLRLDFIELNMNMPEFCPESLPASYLKEMSRKAGIEFSVHMPDDTDLASFHDPIREGHVRRFGETARWAAEAGARLINLHLSPGIFFTLPDRKVWIYERYYDKFLGNLKEAYGKVIDYASDFGLLVCTENVTNFHIPFVAQAVDDLCAALPRFYLTWDIGHDAKTGYLEKPVLMRHQDRIKHMHLHDYNGKSDHQIPFTGQIDIMGALRFAAEREASVLIETKTAEALAESVSAVRARLPELS
jgi:sugar phosphate isomerase/epimerase